MKNDKQHRTTRLRVVFDTNIYFAAASNRGKYADYWLRIGLSRRHFIICSSEPILQELREVLQRTSSPEKTVVADFFVESIKRDILIVRPTEKLTVVSSDPDDNIILECALAAEADLIISADRDLIRLKKFRGISIHHPSDLKYLFPVINMPFNT